jgi:L-rhamnose mutarotase
VEFADLGRLHSDVLTVRLQENEYGRMDKREAFKMFLKPGMKEEYKRRHAAIWPEVRAVLQKNGVYDYVIYLDEKTDTLFAFQHTKGDVGSQDVGSEEAIRKWWHYMKDIMETNADESPVSIPLEEMFYLP